jgi:hypothetical protein
LGPIARGRAPILEVATRKRDCLIKSDQPKRRTLKFEEREGGDKWGKVRVRKKIRSFLKRGGFLDPV